MATEATVVVTLDIGGSAAKAVAYDAVRHRCVASAAMPYPAASEPGDPGLFDPEGWWHAAVGALAELRHSMNEPGRRCLGITVSAVRIPFVLIDSDGSPTMPGLLNRDRRAAGQLAAIAAAVGAANLYRVTGHWLAPEFGLPKLLWVRQAEPSAWRMTRWVLQLHDWFIYRLCGVVAAEPSSAAMSQMLDISQGRWAEDLLGALGFPATMLPELRPAGTRVGGLLPAIADATGFTPGTPVHLGGGDTHLSAESASGGDAVPVVVAGTTAPVQLVVDAPGVAGSASLRYPLLVSEHVTAGHWALETNAGLTGGILARVADLGDQSGGPLVSELRRRGFAIAASAAELTILAGNPFFGPEGWAAAPPPTVIGLRERHRGSDLFQACLRAVCYAVRSVLATPAPLITVTGGMSRSDAWVQMLADATGTPVAVRPLAEINGRAGAILVTGERPAPGSGPAGAAERRFIPVPDAEPGHAAGFARYRELYRAAQLELAAAGDLADDRADQRLFHPGRRVLAGARTRLGAAHCPADPCRSRSDARQRQVPGRGAHRGERARGRLAPRPSGPA
jgi:xylulokinase